MVYTLKMPVVGETVTEGTIERWLKRPGDKIEKYEPVVEINTDKVNVELPSPVSGTVKEIVASEGDTVAVGADMAVIDEAPGEVPAEFPTPQASVETETPDAAPPAKVEVAAGPAIETLPGPEGRRAPPDAAPPPSTSGAPSAGAPAATQREGIASERPRATPRVRHLAEELDVDLARLTGTGPGGRIVEEDVRAAAKGGKAEAAAPPREARQETPPRPEAEVSPAPVTAPPGPAGPDEEIVTLTGTRRTIAQRMVASMFSAPHAWQAMEADVTGLVHLRQSQKEAFRERYGVDLTYLPFFVRVVCQALAQHPYINASWGEDRIILKKRINIGIAAATERGLIVPVIHDADRLTVPGLARAIRELGDKARSGKLALEDVQGGTFTVDNTGSFGSIISMPIINQGQAAIITLEAITKRPVVVAGDAIAIRSIVDLCLSFDHRIVDGAQSGAFLADVKRRLEALSPETGID